MTGYSYHAECFKAAVNVIWHYCTLYGLHLVRDDTNVIQDGISKIANAYWLRRLVTVQQKDWVILYLHVICVYRDHGEAVTRYELAKI